MITFERGPDFAQTEAYFRDMQSRSGNLRDPLQKAVDAYEEEVAEVFASEGPGWAAHRPLTVQARAERGASGGILDETGALQESFMTGGPDHIEKWGADFVEVGSGRKYAAPHQFGFRNKGALRITDKDGRRISIRFKGQPVAAREILKKSIESKIADKLIDAAFAWLKV